MITERAIKAKAYWDLADELREQAASLDPEFSGMLRASDRYRAALLRLNGNPICGPDVVSRITSQALDGDVDQNEEHS